MDGVHDLGGMQGFGAIDPEPEAEEPVFHAGWEARALGLTLAAAALGRWTLDTSRHVRERLPPVVYLSNSYYETWLDALAVLLLEAGVVTPEELASGRPAAAGDPDLAGRRLPAERVAEVLARGNPAELASDIPPAFSSGRPGPGAGHAPGRPLPRPALCPRPDRHDRPLPWRPRAAGRKRPRSPGSAIRSSPSGSRRRSCGVPMPTAAVRGPCGSPLATLSGAGMTTMPNPDDAEPEAPFAEPWQAEAFAPGDRAGRGGRGVADGLGPGAGRGDPPRSCPAGGKRQARPNWRQWLAALADRLLAERGLVAPAEAAERTDAWRDAYLRTPHGQPVDLEKGRRQGRPIGRTGRQSDGPAAVGRAGPPWNPR